MNYKQRQYYIRRQNEGMLAFSEDEMMEMTRRQAAAGRAMSTEEMFIRKAEGTRNFWSNPATHMSAATLRSDPPPSILARLKRWISGKGAA